MKPLFTIVFLVLASSTAFAQTQSLFNGKDLDGWRGNSDLWSVVDGTIMGQTEKGQIKKNTFLVHENPHSNFELTLKYKIVSGNSGIQYRSKVLNEEIFRVSGYQADIEAGVRYSGILYEEGGRGILAKRGQKVVIGKDGKKDTTQPADAAELQKVINQGEWNEYRIVANGNHLQHYINDTLTAEVIDKQPGKRSDSGVIALQLHVGPPMQVFYKDISIKNLGETKTAVAEMEMSTLPKWIWHRDSTAVNEAVFIKSFKAKAGQTVMIRGTCDNEMQVMLNGKKVAASEAWEEPISILTKATRDGDNELRVNAKDREGIAALTLSVTVGDAEMVTDKSWKAATPAEAKANKWSRPIIVGTVGDRALPWRGINAATFTKKASKQTMRQTGVSQKASEAPDMHLPEGFKAELVFNVPKATHGSWVSLTKDDKGRLYVSDQGKKGLYRLTPSKIGDPNSETTVEKINVPVSAAQGLLWAHDSLYTNSYGSGLWRIKDTDGDDQLDKAKLLVPIKVGGEHGAHAIMETQDGKGIYFIAGNHSPMPEGITKSRIPMNWKEDLLLPRNWDPRGHAQGKMAPAGWIARSDPDATDIEIISIGYRNQYDIAFDRNGEMFTYDADMEWDTGSPWYRPTRVCHVTSGSEFGWRSGSGKWPAYFEDSATSVVDIGPGSPTGVVFGTGAKFPAKYQEALFILDWTFGTIYAVHMEPEGATYTATKESFAWSKPLPVTDAIVADDGSLYFTVGGRGTDSALYRISYVGKESTALISGPKSDAGDAARKLRHELEAWHQKVDAAAVPFAWPHLASEDRTIRYAARLAVEKQPVDSWRQKVLSETKPQSLILGAIALARQGVQNDQTSLVEALGRLDLAQLPVQQKLAALRAYSLTFSRLGQPSDATRAAVIEKLDPMFPGDDDSVNTELARVLIYLESPTVVAKTIDQIVNAKPTKLPDWADLATRNDTYGGPIAKMLENMPPLQSIQYAFMLRNSTKGWTLENRKAYFNFFVEAARRSGGPSYAGYLTQARADAIAKLTPTDKHQLADVLGLSLVAPAVEFTPPKGPGRKWTTEEATKVVGNLRGRDFKAGKNLFHALSCSKCHYFAGSGGSIGPDLTSVANKFSDRDLLEAIIEPSKIISDQYASKTIVDEDGMMATGLAIEDEDTISVYSSDASAPPTVFKKDEIEDMKDSKLSQMPTSLIDSLSEEELKDFIAYLKSGGTKRGRMFKR